MVKKGLSIHCHHDILMEYCHDYDKRVQYIKTNKPKNEIEIRLKLFKLLSKEAVNALPKRLIKADAERKKAYALWEKADVEWEKANAERKKAYALWEKADAVWEKEYAEWKKANAERKKAYAEWEKEYAEWKGKEEWHKKFCGCKEWNGKEIIFKEV